MARPALSDTSPTVRTHLVITQAEIDAIDDWRFANRVPSRCEAIRQLLAKAIAANSAGSQ